MMSEPFKVIPLSGVVIPKDSVLQRKHVRNEFRRSEHYLERYDTNTLIYDCFYNPLKQCYTLTAPRFLNLWAVMKSGLQVNGQAFRGRLKRHTWQRCEQVDICAPENAQLSIQHPLLAVNIEVRPTQRSMFANLNVALAISKNNNLEWIQDWAAFHINAHGLEGICIIDNGSTDYSSQELLASLKGISGLKAATILTAPFPYGPVDSSKKLEVSPRFLQTSMFNLVKQDLFADARAILSVDIDELVIPNQEISVFDSAQKSILGAVSFRELKVFPNQEAEQAYGHRVHTRVKAERKFGNTKWCVSGSGFLNRFGWAVHRFGGGFFPFTETTDFTYLHCQGTSTSWKKNRYKKPKNLVQDNWVASVLNKYLD